MDPNRVIGYKGSIPWHLPADLRWFKHMTLGHPLLMGRSTFESLGGKTLRDRYIYILTNDPVKLALPPGSEAMYVNKEGLLKLFNRDLGWQLSFDDMYVCGGAKVYQEFMPYVSEIYVTHLADEYEGDTYMPEFESQFPHWSIMQEGKDFIHAAYRR